MIKSFAVADKDDLLNAACESRVKQRPVEQPTSRDWHDYPLELTALGFMNGDCVGKIDVVETFFSYLVARTLKTTRQRANCIAFV